MDVSVYTHKTPLLFALFSNVQTYSTASEATQLRSRKPRSIKTCGGDLYTLLEAGAEIVKRTISKALLST